MRSSVSNFKLIIMLLHYLTIFCLTQATGSTLALPQALSPSSVTSVSVSVMPKLCEYGVGMELYSTEINVLF